MYTCISFLAIFSLAEESKSYRLDNMNESYDDDTGNNKLINLLTSNSKPNFKCVGGGWGLNVWGGGGGGCKFGTYSILHMFLSCKSRKENPQKLTQLKYFIVFLFNTAVK